MAKNKTTKKTPKLTLNSLAVKAWRQSKHKQDLAVDLLIQMIIAKPKLLKQVLAQYANTMITVVQGRTRAATFEPENEAEVDLMVLPGAVNKSPLLGSLTRTGMLVERDILEYPLQFLRKTLGDATPNEVESVTIARGEAEAKKSLQIFSCFRAIINGLPNKDQPIRQQITAAQARAIAKKMNVYKDLIV